MGGAYTSIEVPDGASVTPSGDGVSIVTGSDASDPLRVIYSLDPSELPAGSHVSSVAVRVCGEATGTNYEIDGPLGVSQSIRVGIPPESDGCWHLDARGTHRPVGDGLRICRNALANSQRRIHGVDRPLISR